MSIQEEIQTFVKNGIKLQSPNFNSICFAFFKCANSSGAFVEAMIIKLLTRTDKMSLCAYLVPI